MKKNKKESTVTASSVLLAVSIALSAGFNQQAEAQTLRPKINGVPFEIDCDRDVRGGRVSTETLERLSSHLHGVYGPNIFTANDREHIINRLSQNFSSYAARNAKDHMLKTLHQYDKAQDKRAFVSRDLRHLNVDQNFLNAIVQKCAP